MAGVRAIQKEKTRRALIDAAFNQLSAEKSFSNLSLREVAREAGIAPTSFYRHFSDMDELGLEMVDEAGLTLRQLMRQARKRIDAGGSVIRVSVETFFEFITHSTNVFRLLLRESSGTSQAFRTAAAREIKHFVDELAEYIAKKNHYSQYAGSNALDMTKAEQDLLKERVILQLRMLAKGADFASHKEKMMRK